MGSYPGSRSVPIVVGLLLVIDDDSDYKKEKASSSLLEPNKSDLHKYST